MRNPQIAITGATGFVGGHLLRELLASGHSVRALVRDASKLEYCDHDKLEIVEGALSNLPAVEQLVEGAQIVIHCAGAIAALDRSGFYDVNVTGAKNIASTSLKSGVDRFILVSSLAAREPQLSDYAGSKKAGEDVVARLIEKEKLVIVRPPAVYGPGDRATLPLIKAFTKKIAVLPGVAHQKMSLIYVKDLAGLLVNLAHQKTLSGGVYEVDDGCKGGYSFKDMAGLAGQAQGRKISVMLLPRAIVSVAAFGAMVVSNILKKAFVFSPAKVNELYHVDWVVSGSQISGWQPEVQFKEGFSLTLSWYQQKGWLSGASGRAKEL